MRCFLPLQEGSLTPAQRRGSSGLPQGQAASLTALTTCACQRPSLPTQSLLEAPQGQGLGLVLSGEIPGSACG